MVKRVYTSDGNTMKAICFFVFRKGNKWVFNKKRSGYFNVLTNRCITWNIFRQYVISQCFRVLFILPHTYIVSVVANLNETIRAGLALSESLLQSPNNSYLRISGIPEVPIDMPSKWSVMSSLWGRQQEGSSVMIRAGKYKKRGCISLVLGSYKRGKRCWFPCKL